MSEDSAGGGRGKSEPGPWQKEMGDIVRAFSGAYLFGIPLLYTMEMWFIGTYLEPLKLLLLLVIALVVNLGLAYFAGFKREFTFSSNIDQAVDAVAVGAVGALIVLLVLDRVSLDDPILSILGKIIIQTVPLSIGASVANILFAPRAGRAGEEVGGNGDEQGGWRDTLNDLGATIAGGIVIGFNVAPTEEIVMLAVELDVGHKLALIAFTLIVTYMLVFVSGFDPQHRGPRRKGIFQQPLSETALAYVVSLVVAFITLSIFNQISPSDPISHITSQTLVLGLPAAIGGAVGRIAL